MSNYRNLHAPAIKARSLFIYLSIIILFISAPLTVSANSSQEISFSKQIYHQHTGTSEGGGCYTVEKQSTKTETVPCEGTMVYWTELGTTSCSKCGASYSGDQSYRRCWYEETRTTKYTYYELGCNQTGKTVLGTLSVTPDITSWTREVILTGSYEIKGKMKVGAKPYIWNDESATAENTYAVRENGEYTLRLNADANANTKDAKVKVTISNIDTFGPAIQSYKLEPEQEWTKEGMLLTITDIQDLQPDKSTGAGLHEQPYSYDGGQTWTTENTHFYAENGTYEVLTRDVLYNVSSLEVHCNRIDVTEPTLHAIEYDSSANILFTWVSVMAEDLQPDKSAGVGLHESAYSFDGGLSWTGENIYYVNRNQKLKIAVRDKLGNTVCKDLEITNIDSEGPEITYQLEPDTWTNQDVILTVSATDINSDETEGSGLAAEWLSFDNGITWTDNNIVEYSQNQVITVIARDKNDNRTEKEITISIIDKTSPQLSVTQQVIRDEGDYKVRITLCAKDTESGLHEAAYSWNGGKKYVAVHTKTVTQNGTYKVAVRDKAGNVQSSSVVINGIPKPEEKRPEEGEDKEEPVKEGDEKETAEEITEDASLEEPLEETSADEEAEEGAEEESVTESIKEEETRTVVKTETKRVDKPAEKPVNKLERDNGKWDKLLMFFGLVLLLLCLLFLFFLWERTIAVYAEEPDGNLRFMGRRWIHDKRERYEVNISEALMGKCSTTHFVFRPGRLFVVLHKDSNLCFLFPENLCIIKKLESCIDISIL